MKRAIILILLIIGFVSYSCAQIQRNYCFTIYYHQNNNFNFNAFNVDLIYEWRFAPGSVLNIVYKNNISRETSFVRHNFNNNMRDLVNDPQSTTVAIKVLYFLDYIKVHGRLAKGLHKSKTMTSYHQSENQVTKRGY